MDHRGTSHGGVWEDEPLVSTGVVVRALLCVLAAVVLVACLAAALGACSAF